ncbi:MAG: hypothetical protein EA407_09865 [Rhodobacteraceae bacterium]|nr:MAG: hypothetical protein EA407_09865 [Paracoccaceae bacterium]
MIRAGFAAAALGLAMAHAAPVLACTTISPQLELCAEGSPLAGMRAQDVDGVVVFQDEAFWIEFNPALTAAAPTGLLAAALDSLLASTLAEGGAPQTETLLRDSFEAAHAAVERFIAQVEEEDETYLGALLLADIADGGGRVAWSLGNLQADRPEAQQELQVLTEVTAAALRPAMEN